MHNQEHQKELILSGPLTRVMWNLSLPAILAMVLFGLNAFMDTVYIGQLMNESALAGVALAYPLTSITMGLGSWAGTGAGNLLSILLGADEKDKQKMVLPNATLMMLVMSLVMTVPCYVFAEDLIELMGGTGIVKDYGVRYFKVTLFAAPLWVYGLGLNMIVRAEGKMRKAAAMMAYGLGVNLVLTPVLIYYLKMDIEGAAWATNIGMLIYCLVGYVYFRSGKPSFTANVHSLRYDRETFSSILKMGLPGFIMVMMGLVQSIVVLNAISNYGTESDLAFFASANRILLFLMTPLFGLMRAFQPVVGINYGAKQFSRVKKSFFLFIKAGFYIVAPFWILMMLFPAKSLHLMLPDTTFTAENLLHFRLYMVVLPFLPLVFIALTYFPAIGEAKYASMAAMARQIVFYVPLMLILPRYMGVGGVYYGSTLIDIIITLWIGVLVSRSFKKHDAESEGATTASTDKA